jgi:hypothetical protein
MTHFDDAAIAADYDDIKVDEFATAMKAKMAKKRQEGRGGWDDPAQCSVEHLAGLLLSHISKGDPVDIANFCMMLFHRNGSKAIQQAACGHYTPGLTESDAARVIRNSDCGNAPAFKLATHFIRALRAAGVRFKEGT